MQKEQYGQPAKEPKEEVKEIKETSPLVIDDKGLDYKDRIDPPTGKVEVRQGDASRGSAKSDKAADKGFGRS